MPGKTTKAVAKKATKALATGAMTPGTIKIIVLKVQRWGSLYAYFHPVITGWVKVDALPEICVSRLKPGNCNFRIDRLDIHDHHAPPFHSEADCDAYIQRVLEDIAAADCGGAKVEVEIQVAETPKATDAEFQVTDGDGGQG